MMHGSDNGFAGMVLIGLGRANNCAEGRLAVLRRFLFTQDLV